MAGTLQEFKAELFHGLAHAVRVRILEALRDGERSVGELQEELGVSGPNVSQHLSTLRNLGIVTARRDGTSALYSVADRRIYRLLDDARAIFEHQLASSTALLESEPPRRP